MIRLSDHAADRLFIAAFRALPQALREQYLERMAADLDRVSCFAFHTEPGAQDAPDSERHSTDAGVRSAGRVVREVVQGVGSAPQEAAPAGSQAEGHHAPANSGDAELDPDCPLHLIRSDKVLQQEKARRGIVA